MIKRILYVIFGGLLTAIGIAAISNSGLGCFSITAAYLGLSDLTGIPFSIVSMIVEFSILIYVCYKGEGIGLSSILAASYVSILIDLFRTLLPNHFSMIFLGILCMLGWAITAKGELGEGSTQMLTTVLMKSTGKSVSFIRTLIEIVFLTIALLTARNQISILTIILTFGTGRILQFFYKLLKYNPVNTNHIYLIKSKQKEKTLNR